MRSLHAALFAVLAACSAGQPKRTDGPAPAPAPAADTDRMAWWREARFGMFVHWGLYAIPAGSWKGSTDYGEWIRDSARIPVDEYERFRTQWNPTQFDADAWARAAKDAGMKYLVLTSKHHDGFCLFDSAETDWDVRNTPHGRDVCAELAAACERHGVVFCTYHSIMDWHHPDYLPRRPWEQRMRSADGADFARYERYLHAQVTEVVTKYHPAVMWFDGEWEATWNHERGVRLFELCQRLSPSMLVNNRVDVHRGGLQGFSQSDEARGDFATPEQEIPATGLPGVDWESCMTMNRHWGFNENDTAWKSTTELVRNLVDVASKGGNYLLNVGPRADGTFPPESVTRLAEIGAWMRTNGEAISGTRASVFDDLAFGRCTVRRDGTDSTIYLHVFDRPQDGVLRLPALGNEVVRAYALAQRERSLPVLTGADGWRIELPPELPTDPHATVVAIDLRGAPIAFRAPAIAAESNEFVHALAVQVTCPTPELEVHLTVDGTEPTLQSPHASAPLRLFATTTVRARGFFGGRAVTPVVERSFQKVEPSPPVEAVAPREGLRFLRADGRFTSLPERPETVIADAWGEVADVALAKQPGEHVLHRYSGFLLVPEDDVYRFALASDDGSKLWLDGQLAIDNDGLHGTVEKQGARALAAGLHPIEVLWFNATGGAELTLRWARPGQPFVPVPTSALRH